jgi:hypothetical protein
MFVIASVREAILTRGLDELKRLLRHYVPRNDKSGVSPSSPVIASVCEAIEKY